MSNTLSRFGKTLKLGCEGKCVDEMGLCHLIASLLGVVLDWGQILDDDLREHTYLQIGDQNDGDDNDDYNKKQFVLASDLARRVHPALLGKEVKGMHDHRNDWALQLLAHVESTCG